MAAIVAAAVEVFAAAVAACDRRRTSGDQPGLACVDGGGTRKADPAVWA